MSTEANIVHGETRSLRLVFRLQSTNALWDISNATAMVVAFPGRSGRVAFTMAGGSVDVTTGGEGVAIVTMSDADIKLMRVGENQRIEVEISFGSDNTRIFQPSIQTNIRAKRLPA